MNHDLFATTLQDTIDAFLKGGAHLVTGGGMAPSVVTCALAGCAHPASKADFERVQQRA